MASDNSNASSLTWLVSGCSSGIGRELVLQALARNQRVIATGRSAERLSDLKAKGAHVFEVDINQSPEVLNVFAQEILNEFGKIDMLVNNAGYTQMGTIEETGYVLCVVKGALNELGKGPSLNCSMSKA